MSELPENLNDWPGNPRDVLGISRDASAKEIRRAYFRLIRRFTPDDFPAQFQRIRECYEMAEAGWGQIQEASSRESLGLEHPGRDETSDRNRDRVNESREDDAKANGQDVEVGLDSDSDNDRHRDHAATSSDSSMPLTDSPFRRESIHDSSKSNLSNFGNKNESNWNRSKGPLDEIWNLIDQGEFETARLQLEKLNQIDRSSFATDLRQRKFLLYYLKRFDDSDDSDELVLSRLTLLIDVLNQDEFRIAAELRLREEAFWNPRPFVSDQFLRLFLNSTCPNTVDFLYRLRWECLGKSGFKTILEDVTHLKTIALHLGENRLMGLIQESIEFTVWMNSCDANQHYRESYDFASSNAGVGGSDYEVADTMEYIWEAAKEWQELSDQQLGFVGLLAVKMIPFSRTDGHLAKIERWRESLSFVPLNPKGILGSLDELIHLYPIAMSIFHDEVISISDLMIDEDDITIPFNHAESLLKAFFSSLKVRTYDGMRSDVLRFCCENSMSIYQFGYIADSAIMELCGDDVGWSEMIERDTALQCAFWISMVNF